MLAFEAGVIVGLVIGTLLFGIVGRVRNNHSDYWRMSYCMEAEYVPVFCAEYKPEPIAWD